ncbi:MAG: hypothetical protein AAF637_18720, partial [Pseudomonadota bacterium]
GLTKVLGRQVLASGAFTRCLSLPWEALGRYQLRGLGQPREVFALPVDYWTGDQAAPSRQARG